ncbi:PTS sugar transporter subunit IIB, partial [Tetragenococcus halophilus]
MAEKTIMLVCSAGMSTSLLVTKMQKAADDKGLDAEIFACSSSEADQKLESNSVDVRSSPKSCVKYQCHLYLD